MAKEQNLLGREEEKKERGKKKDQIAYCLSQSAFSWQTLVREFPRRDGDILSSNIKEERGGPMVCGSASYRNWFQIVTGLEMG